MHEADCHYETAEAATKAAIAASGLALKQVASALFPDRSPAAAHTALANALNENRAERLTADQHVLVANLTERYQWLAYVACRCGYEPPKRKEPNAEVAELRELLRQQLHMTETISARLASMEERAR